MPRFGAYDGARSIRASPIYQPYRRAIKCVAGTAKTPSGPLGKDTVIGRGKLFDTLIEAPECTGILSGITVPKMLASEIRAGVSGQTKGILVVVGTVMTDLGYFRYSSHAWCRTPLFPVEPEKTTDRPFQEESCGVLHTTLSTYSQEGRKEGRAGLETMGLV